MPPVSPHSRPAGRPAPRRSGESGSKERKAMAALSPLAPSRFPDLLPISGVRLAAHAGGIRYTGRDDLMLAELAPGSAVAGVLTRSLTAGAPILWCRNGLRSGTGRAILVNSGNANVFTGRAGNEAVAAMAGRTAELLGCDPGQVFVSSTGVIGETLPTAKILGALPRLVAGLSPNAWERAARAIMTTDTFPKGAAATATIDGVAVRLNGFAKGSGMIAPDMATMLAYVFTDAALPAAVLQTLLSASADRSFNAITVDGDTSTSDTVLLCATGQAVHRPVADPGDRRLDDFRHALDAVLVDLAQQVVRDGEGAQKFVTIEVKGAATARAARRIGLAIGNSPLVKTAISAGDIEIAAQGGPVPGYDEAPVTEHMKGREIAI